MSFRFEQPASSHRPSHLFGCVGQETPVAQVHPSLPADSAGTHTPYAICTLSCARLVCVCSYSFSTWREVTEESEATENAISCALLIRRIPYTSDACAELPPPGRAYPHGGSACIQAEAPKFWGDMLDTAPGNPRRIRPCIVPSVREKRAVGRPRNALAGAAIADAQLGVATQAHFESRTAQFGLHTRNRTCAPSLSACRRHANHRHNSHRQCLPWPPPVEAARKPPPRATAISPCCLWTGTAGPTKAPTP